MNGRVYIIPEYNVLLLITLDRVNGFCFIVISAGNSKTNVFDPNATSRKKKGNKSNKVFIIFYVFHVINCYMIMYLPSLRVS